MIINPFNGLSMILHSCILFIESDPLRFYIEYIIFMELRKAQTANAVMDVLGNTKLRFS